MTKVDRLAFAGRAIDNLFWWAALGMHDVTVNAREADRFDASMTKRGENICIYLARKNHLRHFQSIVVGHPAPFNNCLLDAQLPGQIAQLFSSAMNDTDTNADLMQQSKFFAERDQPIMIFSNFT